MQLIIPLALAMFSCALGVLGVLSDSKRKSVWPLSKKSWAILILLIVTLLFSSFQVVQDFLDKQDQQRTATINMELASQTNRDLQRKVQGQYFPLDKAEVELEIVAGTSLDGIGLFSDQEIIESKINSFIKTFFDDSEKPKSQFSLLPDKYSASGKFIDPTANISLLRWAKRDSKIQKVEFLVPKNLDHLLDPTFESIAIEIRKKGFSQPIMPEIPIMSKLEWKNRKAPNRTILVYTNDDFDKRTLDRAIIYDNIKKQFSFRIKFRPNTIFAASRIASFLDLGTNEIWIKYPKFASAMPTSLVLDSGNHLTLSGHIVSQKTEKGSYWFPNDDLEYSTWTMTLNQESLDTIRAND